MGQSAFGCVSLDSCEAKAHSLKIAVARHVLEAEAPFGEMDVANCSLIRAAQDGDLSGIKHAFEAGADINTRLPMWIRIGYLEDANEHANEHAHSHANEHANESSEEWVDGSGFFTPLIRASQEGHAEAVKLLLKLGANTHIRDADGMQALHLAAQSGSVECFRALIEAGSDPLILDEFNRTAVECAPLGVARHTCLTILKEHAGISPPVAETEEAAYNAAASGAGAATWLVEDPEMDRDTAASKETTSEQNSEILTPRSAVEACVLNTRKLSVGSNSTEASLVY